MRVEESSLSWLKELAIQALSRLRFGSLASCSQKIVVGETGEMWSDEVDKQISQQCTGQAERASREIIENLIKVET